MVSSSSSCSNDSFHSRSASEVEASEMVSLGAESGRESIVEGDEGMGEGSRKEGVESEVSAGGEGGEDGEAMGSVCVGGKEDEGGMVIGP